MRKPLFREVVLLSLPLLIMGGIVFWQLRKPLTDDSISRVAPIDATLGELRLEFGEWKDVTPSAGEIATGYTVKKLGRVWLAGYEAKTWKQPHFSFINAKEFGLEYRRSDKWHRVEYEGGWNGIRETAFYEKSPDDTDVQSQKFALALPLSLVPKEAVEVRLRGRIKWRISSWWPGKTHVKNISTPEVIFPIWKKGEPWPNPNVSRKSGISVSYVQSPLMGIAANRLGNSDDFLIGARATATLEGHVLPWGRDLKLVNIWPQSLQLLDKSGRNWLRIEPSADFGFAPPEQASGSSYGKDVRIYGLGNIARKKLKNCQIDISTLHIPKSVGELHLNAKIALFDDTNKTSDWPAEFNTVVRPQWLCQQPASLKLKSVHLIKRELPLSAERITSGMIVPCIEADLEYTGKKVLFPRGEIVSSKYGHMDDELISAQIPYGQGGRYSDTDRRMRRAGEDELICSWSQHIEDSKGEPTTKVFSDQIGNTNIILEKPEISKVQNRTYVKVRYYLDCYEKLETPHFFKAEIGIRDEGMIDIVMPLQ